VSSDSNGPVFLSLYAAISVRLSVTLSTIQYPKKKTAYSRPFLMYMHSGQFKSFILFGTAPLFRLKPNNNPYNPLPFSPRSPIHESRLFIYKVAPNPSNFMAEASASCRLKLKYTTHTALSQSRHSLVDHFHCGTLEAIRLRFSGDGGFVFEASWYDGGAEFSVLDGQNFFRNP